jgi:hypothetical protein
MSLRSSLALAGLAAVLCPWNHSHAGEPTAEIVAILRAWEAASEGAPRSSSRAALAAHHESHSAHELDAVCEMLGAVSADRLLEAYEWTHGAGDGEIHLTGTPRDVTTSLFFSGFDIVLDRATYRPKSIHFRAGNGAPRASAITAPMAGRPDVPSAKDRNVVRPATYAIPRAELEPAALPAELQSVHDQWVEASRGIHNAEIRFERYEYDTVFLTEKRGKGRFLYHAPDLAVYEIEGAEIPAGTQSKRVGHRGQTYTLQPATEFRAHLGRGQLWLIDPEQRRYDQFECYPSTTTGKDFRHYGVFGIPWSPRIAYVPGMIAAAEMTSNRNLQWTFGPENEHGVIVVAQSAFPAKFVVGSRIEQLLDRETYRTKASRVISSSGQTEVVHVFEYVSVNTRELKREQFVPDLNGLSKASHARSDR